jgi:hypothetical protein
MVVRDGAVVSLHKVARLGCSSVGNSWSNWCTWSRRAATAVSGLQGSMKEVVMVFVLGEDAASWKGSMK